MIYEHSLDKRLLRRSFEKAAETYDHAAVLQREICDRMLSRLDFIKYLPDFILDMGSGTGYGTQKLRERYDRSTIIALDIALNMHLQAYRPISGWRKWISLVKRHSIDYVTGDIEQLPLQKESVNMIWSNLALQWCNDLKQSMTECHRVLKPGRLIMFSTFGPDTLSELRKTFKAVDSYQHINRFIDMHDIGDILVHAGFAEPVMDMEYITLTYQDVASIMRDLKAIGAHNVMIGRKKGLMGKRAWQQIIDRYELLRQSGKLPATYEVVYGHAWKPESKLALLKATTKQKLGISE
ncbi:MAG: malonyl-ACP O-methyltransferase BioC [Nitrosomonas sp.]|nr:MAG: malonyl-ACP O-methyltransferase BioC [Nitrosomonas sp.]